ncbi:SAM-dependent methyltransferase [Acinetobacter sp. NCu2D-2]|uniref:class I SAM-dependent methyltransferase n=1 Tax=Acinetobacter sp. NCu2D-2 TaxID=1608473 RepID=UPI0007CDD094|nr:class I SAM-dependent methyltransferase [Acinetobacter sp. NCu2D-2]ANF80926.1 SAM-dependent methyltransferase [Acinetobacter sp. NCu2D-2]
MTHSIHPSAKQGFSAAATLYQQVRPHYPAQIHEILKSHLQLNQNAQLVDLGTGTGKFLPYLKALSSHILAIDPVAEMLSELKQAHPDIQTLQASSDELPLLDDSIDAVFCAQSFHWFANRDSLQEIHRILKKDGALVLIWNQRDVSIDWVKALADVITPYEDGTPRFHRGDWAKVFEQQDLFELCFETTLPFVHQGLVEQVVSKRLLSTSFIAAMPKEQQQQLKHQFEQIVVKYLGKQPTDHIEFPYRTHLYIFKHMK